MRLDTSKPFVDWRVRVPQIDRDQFKSLLPIYGAQTWFVDAALEKFLAMVEVSEEFQGFCKAEIQQHLYNEERHGVYEIITVTIRTSLYLRFNQVLPGRGATSWFVRRVLQAMNHELNGFVLDDRVEAAVRAVFRGEH